MCTDWSITPPKLATQNIANGKATPLDNIAINKVDFPVNDWKDNATMIVHVCLRKYQFIK